MLILAPKLELTVATMYSIHTHTASTLYFPRNSGGGGEEEGQIDEFVLMLRSSPFSSLRSPFLSLE